MKHVLTVVFKYWYLIVFYVFLNIHCLSGFRLIQNIFSSPFHIKMIWHLELINILQFTKTHPALKGWCALHLYMVLDMGNLFFARPPQELHSLKCLQMWCLHSLHVQSCIMMTDYPSLYCKSFSIVFSALYCHHFIKPSQPLRTANCPTADPACKQPL